MAAPAADMNLLFAVLALQNELVGKEDLLAAMNAWGLERHRPLRDILVERGALLADDRELLDALIERQLRRHGSAQESLAAVPVSSSVKEHIRSVCPPDLEASLAHLGTVADPQATVSALGADGGGDLRYRILRLHAEGGLGEVFVAEDTELHRQVALKQIRARHSGDHASRGRFVLEAEITGGLEHPGIVPVYGLGSHADGRPFYAMRFIRGDNLKEAIQRFHGSRPRGESSSTAGPSADYSSLAFRQLLGRFIDVCNAIAYAHSRGVLHRDLKPGNIMLGKFGETLVVDWGLAKVVGRSEPEAPRAGEEAPLQPASASALAATMAGSAPGTPAYMSPEQAAGKIPELGAATDVYSLGATLYTLLTNRPPVAGSNTAEVLRKVQQGDIDWQTRSNGVPQTLVAVCRKAMAIEPADRYATPLALAEDLEHWLADEPVSAYPDPVLLRTGRWMRKNRTLVGSAAAALVVATIGSMVAAALLAGVNSQLDDRNRMLDTANGQLAERNTQLDDANARLAAANVDLTTANADIQATNAKLELARKDAEAKRQQAEEQTQVALAVRKFLQHDLLLQADPMTRADRVLALGRDRFVATANPTIKELLDRAASELTPEKIDQKFSKQPVIQGAILNDVGQAYLGIGEYAKAASHFERARAIASAEFGPDDRRTLASTNDLALAYEYAGKMDLAMPLYEATLKRMTAVLGPDDHDTLSCVNNLAGGHLRTGKPELAITHFQDVIKRTKEKIGPDHRQTLTAMANLAYVYSEAEKLEQALPLFDETLKLMKDKLGLAHPTTLICMNNLARAYMMAGKPALAVALQEETLKQSQTHNGADHPDTLLCMCSLGGFYLEAGKLKLAVDVLEKALGPIRANQTLDHRFALTGLGNLGLAYLDLGKLATALPLLQEAHEHTKAKVGPQHPDTFRSMNNLARAQMNAGNVLQAFTLYNQAFEGLKATRGLDRADTLIVLGNLAQAYRDAGRPDLALPRFEETFQRMKAKLGAEHPYTLFAMSNLASGYDKVQQRERALPLYVEALKLMNIHLGVEHPATLMTMNNLGLAYLTAGKLKQAFPLLEETLRLRKDQLGPTHPDTLQSINNLAGAYRESGNLKQAIPLFEQALEGRKVALGADHPRTLVTMDNLALAYRADGRLEEALRLFDGALKLFRVRLGDGHPETLICLRSTASAHLQAGHTDQAMALFRELIAGERNRPGKSEIELAGALASIGFELLGGRQFVEADKVLRDSLAVRTKKQPHLWTTFNTQSLLGGALLGQKQYADAEPLLLAGYQGMKEREESIPPLGRVRLTEAEARLAELFDATRTRDERKLAGALTDAQAEVVHEQELTAGRAVVIEMRSKKFDTYLRLEDAKGKVLAENDDIDLAAKNTDSRILFMPKASGVYRVVATSFQRQGRGGYEIIIRQYAAKAK
jgi:eukaryotic-like serine/threonine-protein kinase